MNINELSINYIHELMLLCMLATYLGERMSLNKFIHIILNLWFSKV